MTTAIADVVSAVRRMLLDDAAVSAFVDDRIWGGRLDDVEVASMPRKNIVVKPGGRLPSAGSNSYLALQRMRLDVRCYGEDEFEAMRVYRYVDAYMRAIEPQTVDLTDHSVRVLNAVDGAGPIPMTDPDTDWPSVDASYGILASTVAIAPEVVSS